MAAIPLPSNKFTYKRITGTDRAANTEVSETVPVGKFWWLVSFKVVCVQGATQTPLPFLTIDDGTTTFLEVPGTTTAQAVSTTATYTWASDIQLTGQIGTTPSIRSNGPLPSNLLLLPGYRIQTVTQGIGANTDYGAPSYYVVELDMT